MGQETYECSDCKKHFQNTEMEFEEIPDNMSFAMVNDDKIPKCPHCGYLEFFGFKVVDIAF